MAMRVSIALSPLWLDLGLLELSLSTGGAQAPQRAEAELMMNAPTLTRVERGGAGPIEGLVALRPSGCSPVVV